MTANPIIPQRSGLRFYAVPLSLRLDNNPSALAEDFVQSDPIPPLRSPLSSFSLDRALYSSGCTFFEVFTSLTVLARVVVASSPRTPWPTNSPGMCVCTGAYFTQTDWFFSCRVAIVNSDKVSMRIHPTPPTLQFTQC